MNNNNDLKFNSVEEAMEFVKKVQDDPNIHGFIGYQPEGEPVRLYDLQDFVKEVGLEAAAEHLYKVAQNNAFTQTEITTEEFKKIMDKAKVNPDSLTKEEKIILDYFLKKYADDTDGIKAIIEAFFGMLYQSGSQLSKTVPGVFSLIMTICELLLVHTASNESIRITATNRQMRDVIFTKAADAILAGKSKEMDKELYEIGLLNLFGTTVISNLNNDRIIDYEKLCDEAGFDRNVVIEGKFEEDEEEKPEPKTDPISSISDEISKILNDTDSSARSTAAPPQSVRDRMKKNR